MFDWGCDIVEKGVVSNKTSNNPSSSTHITFSITSSRLAFPAVVFSVALNKGSSQRSSLISWIVNDLKSDAKLKNWTEKEGKASYFVWTWSAQTVLHSCAEKVEEISDVVFHPVEFPRTCSILQFAANDWTRWWVPGFDELTIIPQTVGSLHWFWFFLAAYVFDDWYIEVYMRP